MLRARRDGVSEGRRDDETTCRHATRRLTGVTAPATRRHARRSRQDDTRATHELDDSGARCSRSSGCSGRTATPASCARPMTASTSSSRAYDGPTRESGRDKPHDTTTRRRSDDGSTAHVHESMTPTARSVPTRARARRHDATPLRRCSGRTAMTTRRRSHDGSTRPSGRDKLTNEPHGHALLCRRHHAALDDGSTKRNTTTYARASPPTLRRSTTNKILLRRKRRGVCPRPTLALTTRRPRPCP